MLGTVSVSSIQVPLEKVWDSHCRDLYEYWDKLRGDRIGPTWREFQLVDLPLECLRHIHVVDIRNDPFDIVYRFWGTGLTDVLHFDRTGSSQLTTNMGYLEESRRQQVIADYRKVIGERIPLPFLWDAHSTRRDVGPLVVPSIRIPISDDGERVTQVATHFDFTQDRTKWEEVFLFFERNRLIRED